MLHTMPTATLHYQRLPHRTPVPALLVFHSHWNTTKRSSPLFKRLIMRSLEVIVLAAFMLVAPFAIHGAMLCFDDVYELLGRRAASPYAEISWSRVMAGVGMMAGWTLVLGRLGYLADVEGEEKRGPKRSDHGHVGRKMMQNRRVSWGRILGRISIPLVLVTLTGHLALEFSRRAAGRSVPSYLVSSIIGSEVDVEEMVDVFQ